MATKETPQKGDKVRVVLEGTVGVLEGDGVFWVGDRHENIIHPATDHVKSVEILEKAKPEWLPLRDGDSFTYEGDYRVVLGGRVFCSDGCQTYSPLEWYEDRHDRIQNLYRASKLGATRTPGPEPF